ncbi:MAG TPA: TolC family outer membrane protein [Geminicoccaceae bacterium]|nr:TolC family outer membrane protein [Geminicoccaceae bacterium]
MRNASSSTLGRILTVMLAPLAVVTGAGATTLEESVRATLATNPDIGVVQADREAIDQELRQARAQYLPSIDLRGAVGPEYTNSPGTRRRATRPPGGDSATTLMRWESQITLSQLLFDGFATQSEVARQISRIDSAAFRVQEAAEFTALDAIEAHLEVLRNQILVVLARENLAEHLRILGLVRELEGEGAGSIADVRQTEARIAAAQSSLATALGNLRDAEALYIAAVGMPPEALQDPVVPFPAVPESQEAAAAEAVVSSPTVLIATADIDVAEAELRGSRAGNYPRFDLELGAAANDNLDGVKGGDVEAQALLVVRYNLFRGGADVAREREAFARLREARQALRQIQRDAAEEARIAYNALQTAQARLEALRAAVEAQRATRDVYAQQFDLGQRSLLDLLDAENELFIARSNLVTAQFTEIFGVYRVLAVTGDLLIALDIDRPKESISIYRERQEPVHERVPTIDGNAD